MLAAVSASGKGFTVTIIEKNNQTGKKLAITGKGRCNVTNNCTEQEFLENVVSNPKFLIKAAYRFPPAKVMEFFESLGVPLKTERGRRVFPVSDKASDICTALEKKLSECGVNIIKGEVNEILHDNGRVSGIRYFSSDGTNTVPARSVILAAGGMSYPKTGSDGGGYRLASRLGHTVITPRPSLVPLVTKERWPGELTGLSLKNVNVSFERNGKVLFSEQGEMLFTHFGVSGPLVLSGSAYVKSFPADMYIDMKPALSNETLDARLLADFEEFKNKDFINALDKLLPKAIIPAVAALSGIDGRKKINSVTKSERTKLAALLKAIPLTITGPRPVDEAIITSGGVKVSEVNPSTMESKLVGGLYFAGEVLDIDCYTGGYNLQAAFCTGFLAGENAAK